MAMRKEQLSYEQSVYAAQGPWPGQEPELYIPTFGVFRSKGHFRYVQVPAQIGVHLIESGSGTIVCDGEVHQVCGGQLYVFWPGQRMLYYDQVHSPWRYSWFWLAGRRAEALLTLAGCSRAAPHHCLPANSRLQAWLARALARFRGGSLAGAAPMALAWEFVEALRLDLEPTPRDNAAPTVAQTCRHLIETLYMNSLTVDDLARQLHVQRTTLFRQFRAAFGQSPKQYLSQVRLQEAGELLRHSRSSVKEVALSCGFDDARYFARVFRAHYGLPPGQWRQQ